MKKPLNSLRFAARFLGALGLAAAVFVPAAQAQVRPTHRPELPDFDKRGAGTMAFAPDADVQRGKARLQEQLPSAAVDLDPLLGSPKFIRANDGFLTGPNGRGRAVSEKSALALPADDPNLAIKAFLNDHSVLFGYDASALSGATVKRDYVDAHNGLRTVVWEQQLDGVAVYGGVLMGHITRNGELASIGSLFVPNPASAAQAGTPGYASLLAAPPISELNALSLAAATLGADLAETSIQTGPAKDIEGGYRVFLTPDKAYLRQVWLPLAKSSLRLAWEVIISSPTTKERFRVLVDAISGEAYLRHNMTCYISDATYNVFPGDSPSPFTPSLPTPGAFQPPLTNRTLITTPALDTTASPEGWIPDGGNTTTGNNADAFLDRDFNQQPDIPTPQGNPNRVFDFPLDLTQDPTNYASGSIVQLFWRANWYHDRLYQLGFTEAAGNFQSNNFGRGGVGGDNILCCVQAGADVGMANNSAFMTPPDGINGECYMFVFTTPNPTRDGALDSEVVVHELTHGTSTRLVGGGGGAIDSLQGGGLGEGWSDFYSLSLLSDAGEDANANYAVGGYAGYRLGGLTENYYYGIRHFPYSTDMTKNPFTFKDIDPAQISPHPGIPRNPIYPFDPAEANEVHHSGEVWCSALWEVRANLVTKYGWAVGNQLVLQLATDGMKLTPAFPNFLQARDAILLADRIDNGGANIGEIWRGFAKRGMGASATSPNGNTTAGVHEAFDLPGLMVDRVVVTGGNGNGSIDPVECNDLLVYLYNNSGSQATGITVDLSTTTPGVIVVQGTAGYPPIPDGATNANQTPFRISTGPDFVCGKSIDFTLTVKTDQSTSVTSFRLLTGTPNPPLRFDSSVPVPIPDGDPVGVASPIVVSNITSAIRQVAVSLHITHTYDQDLTLKLISPDGTTNTLSAHHGFSGRNYGTACSPEGRRTTFSDDALISIGSGNPPFVGSFQPDQQLVVFSGKAGTNVNGAWLLLASDDATGDVGTLECWSLFLSTATCDPGFGECPGSDLALGMTAVPEPVVLGGYLTYNISVTNNGPSSAKNVIVTHLLPAGAIFISSSASQGSVAQGGSVATISFGTLTAGAKASASITVLPTSAALVTSTATANSDQPDFNPSNNSITVVSRISPPTADVSIGLRASPEAVVLGDAVTVMLSVTNAGPSTASAVLVTNVLPPNVAIQAVSISQGVASTPGGNVVLCSFGSITNGGRATASITVTAINEGQAVATAMAVANQTDPNPGNNTASASFGVGPSADLAIGMTDNPDPVLIQSNLTYVLTVTNLGPSAASGVVVNQTLPPGVQLVSSNTTQGTIIAAGGSLNCLVGNLAKGATAAITVRVTSSNPGSLISSAVVSAAQADANTANNSASVSTLVSAPFITVVAAGATLKTESIVPPNGAVDNGETVSVVLRLRNSGNVPTTNLVATLLATNGIAPGTGSVQTFGVLSPSGFAVGKTFNFTATGTPGSTVSAVLQLQDGASAYAPVSFSFTLPSTYNFTNTAAITIPSIGNADPYPSTINVSGITGTVGKVTATLLGFTHSYPHDVTALLAGPTGASSFLMSSAGSLPTSDAYLTFDDSAAERLPELGAFTSGAFQPAFYGGSPPHPVALSTFNSLNPMGTWSLYITDGAAGDFGAISNGWSLALTTISPVNQLAELGIMAAATPAVSLAGSNITCTFTITNAGPNAATVVAFTNLLPASVSLVSAAASQGALFTSAASVIGNLGGLGAGATATVTVVLSPSAGAAGVLANTASVSASEVDLNLANNTATAVSSVSLPSADIGVSLASSPEPVLVGSNVTVTAVITNRGPGLALNVSTTNRVPAALTLVSATASLGTASQIGSAVVHQLDVLAAGSSATLTMVFRTSTLGSFTNTVSTFALSSDPNPGDNQAATVGNVVLPSPHIVTAGTIITAESFSPPNGAVDAGETVSVSLFLRNDGSAKTANLVGTLQASGGVTPLGTASKSYGQLLPGSSAANSFSFAVSSLAASPVIATLQLNDGSVNLGTVAFLFDMPSKSSFTNNFAITIPERGSASPYPSSINVSGLTGLVSKVTATLYGVQHSFPRDINALLVGPSGGKVMLMSHAGGAYPVTNVTLTFDDSAAGRLPGTNMLVSGTFQPGAYGTAPAFPPAAPAQPFAGELSALNGGSPNGAWSLFVFDDSGGDAGMIASGWSLAITTVNIAASLADVAVGLASTPPSLFAGEAIVNSISVTNLGPNPASAVVVTNTLAAGANFVSASSSQGAIGAQGGAVVWNVGELAAGASASAQVRSVPQQPGSAVSTASVACAQTDLNTANNTAVSESVVSAPAPATLSGVLTNGEFRLTVAAQPNLTYVIQVSSDLASWVPLSTNTASGGGTIKYIDTTISGIQTRFYRTVRVVP